MNQQKETIEIDVMSLLKLLWRRKFLILLVSLFTSIVALGYSMFVVTPEYSSTTRIYVVNRSQSDNPGLTNQDLQAGTYLVKDYREIILSQDVLNQLISDLKLDLSIQELTKKISVQVPTDTRIVSITVEDSTPEEASRIANALREVAAQKIIAVTRVSDVTTLEEAIPATTPSSPNIRRNVLLGFVGGFAVITVVVLLTEILDDRVKRPEDVEDTMKLTLLGVIPNIDKL
ncbi:Tyrosine-protein kinase transmembrane modulator EpsC [Streptococcus sp. DD10]|uniref:CspC family polysaccharide chain length determinant protein n=1 Tax=Streptococcus sp. DD10 TaxID=1777878 RepID=UPI000798E771|nr:Wzz/FepE/Etk N-terminal domain-containing protein [Streptococcus sp. DD10]KXT72769.1 Tyrosine-protein kinase transmembrane modulator EpsC [Streptococcus sp. DD10]